MPSQEHPERRPLIPMSPEQAEALRRSQLSRRSLLRRTGGVAAVAVGAASGTAIVGGEAITQDAPPAAPYEYAFEGVPETPLEPPEPQLQALTEQEAAVVEALAARILPGTPEDPGAREAGVLWYIDALLAYNSGIHEATYTAGPWARTYTGDEPPGPDDAETIWVHADEIHRYGYQAPFSPLQVYQIAVGAIDAHARREYGAGVAELGEVDQDRVIWDMLDESIDGFDRFSPIAFFRTLRRHVSEGMFSDPGYGGNRGLVGWKLVGFPGSQRGYAPEELLMEDRQREPQAMHDLPAFNPGIIGHDDHENVVQPVREGEDEP